MFSNVRGSGLEVWQAGAIGEPEKVVGRRVVQQGGGVVSLRVVRLLHHHPPLEGVGLSVWYGGCEAREPRVGAAQQARQAAGVQACLSGEKGVVGGQSRGGSIAL